MKKIISAIFFVMLILVSCNRNSGNSTVNADSLDYSDSGKIFQPTATEEMSTDYVFNLKMKIPHGFRFDTINVRDSIHKTDYTLYCLQSSLPGMEKFNTTIKRELLLNVKKDMQFTDSFYDSIPVDPVYTYELGPFEFFMNDKLLSLCCIIDTYGFQGNHHNYTWYTFNYDLKKNEIIRFSDVFKINSAKDTSDFAELVLRNRREENACMDLEVPFDSLDFSFVKKGICINPDLSWACSMQRAFLSPDSLRNFMNKEWEN
ncbi:MAG TPA: hypothetical protein VFJ43_09925 [Bacteroidia bacterium]|nr:hypothetical protein [Bacteroidia bacterium]